MWGTDFSRKRASLGGMTQPMEKYIWGVRQSNSLGDSSDAARCCQHRSNWFNYTHCQACGDDEQCRINANRGPWQLFAQAHLLTRDKDLSQPATRVDTTRWQLFISRYQYGPFLFFVAEVTSNYLTTAP